MRLGHSLLSALLLAGCATASRPEPVILGPPAPIVVHLRLQIFRDWSSPFYIVADFTLEQAEAFGMSAELWAWFAAKDPGNRYYLAWVRPIYASSGCGLAVPHDVSLC